MATQQEKMENFIEDVIRWREGEDCTYCPILSKCQYVERNMDKDPPCIKNIAKHFLRKLLTN